MTNLCVFLTLMACAFPVFASAATQESVDLPTLAAYRAVQPPVIDGMLDEKFWQESQATTDMWKLDGSGRAGQLVVTQVAYDDRYIYVGCRCPLKDAEAVKAAKALTAEQMFGPDTVEIFLAPYAESDSYYQFAVNAANGHYSEFNNDNAWANPWKSATHIGDDAWSVEIAIPLSSLAGGEKMTSTWGLNITRMETCWAPTFGSYHLVHRFGKLTGIDAALNAYRWKIDVVPGSLSVGDAPITVLVDNLTGKGRNVALDAEIRTESGDLLAHVQKSGILAQSLRDVKWTFNAPLSKPELHTVSVSVSDEAGVQLANYSARIAGPRDWNMVWNRSFYMSEKNAVLTLDCGIKDSAGAAFQCELRKAGESFVLQTRKARLSKQRRSRLTFDLTGLPVGRYDVIIVPGEHSTGMTGTSTTLVKLEPKPGAVQYTDRGVLLRDGTPFFPFGFYYIQRYLNGDFLSEYAASGFNTQVMEWSSATGYVNMLNDQKPFGVVPMVGIQNSAEVGATKYTGPESLPAWETAARGLVREVAGKAGDNILAWYTWDEPPLGFWHQVTKRFHEIVHEEDPYHPTITVNFRPNIFHGFADATDIFAPDPYPMFPGGRMRRIGDWMDIGAQWFKNKPLMAVIQTFSEAGGVMPGPEEVRCMTYLSIVHGAQGVMYFSYDYRVGPMAAKNPRTWAELQKLAGEVRSLAPVLLSDPPSRSSVTKTGGDRVDTKLYKHDGYFYLVAVNTNDVPAKLVKFSIKGASEVTVMFENRSAALSGDSWVDAFEPYAVHIYRIQVK